MFDFHGHGATTRQDLDDLGAALARQMWPKFYGIVLGAISCGYFSGIGFRFVRTVREYTRYYGAFFGTKFYGWHVGWPQKEWLAAVVELCEVGMIPAHEVVAFELQGQSGLSKATRGRVLAHLDRSLVIQAAPSPLKLMYEPATHAQSNRLDSPSTKLAQLHSFIRYSKSIGGFRTGDDLLFKWAVEKHGADYVVERWWTYRDRWKVQHEKELKEAVETSTAMPS